MPGSVENTSAGGTNITALLKQWIDAPRGCRHRRGRTWTGDESHAFFAEQLVFGHKAIFENNARRFRSTQTEFVFLL